MTQAGRTRSFFDYNLFFVLLFICIFGVIMIYSSSSYTAQVKFGDAGYFMARQTRFIILGFLVMFAASMIPYRFFLKLWWLVYGAALVLLILVAAVGKEISGGKRWLYIGPISIQPSEIGKLALILCMATVIANRKKDLETWKGFILTFTYTLPIIGLVIVSNLSAGIILLGIVFVMAAVVSRRKDIPAIALALCIVVLLFAQQLGTYLINLPFLKGFQVGRILSWLDPEGRYEEGAFQIIQGLYAIGSGGMFGKGIGKGMQKFILPEAQNDMIFAIICEECGIFGAVIVIITYIVLLYRMRVIAAMAPDLQGSLLVIGIMAHIGIQAVLNIAVATNAIPNTGITLPFISYGGSAVIILLAEVGIVLSVARSIRME